MARASSSNTHNHNNNNNNNNHNHNHSNHHNPRTPTVSSPAPMLESHSVTKVAQRAKGATLTAAKKTSERARARWAVVRTNLKQVIALKAELNKYSSITDRRKRLEKIAVVDDATVTETQQEILGELGVGEHVGSHAFLRNAPHAFSVIATQACRYYALQLAGS